MDMESIFDQEFSAALKKRVNNLHVGESPNWGQMKVEEMLAHCNLTYDLVFTDHYVKAEAFNRLVYSTLMIDRMTNEEPYPQNMETAPALMIDGEYSFDEEKEKLINNLDKVLELGPDHFNDEKENMAFGKLNSFQWHMLFYKHLDHHLNQFGV